MTKMLTKNYPFSGVHKREDVTIHIHPMSATGEWPRMGKMMIPNFNIIRRNADQVKEQIDKVLNTICEVHRPSIVHFYHWNDSDQDDPSARVAITYEKNGERYVMRRLDAKLSDSAEQVG